MNRPNTFTKFFAAAVGIAAMSAAFGALASDAIHGRVRTTHDDNVEVCFYDGYTPAAGAEFALLRNVVVTSSKSQNTIRRANVGAIRLSQAVEHGCAAAKLLRGRAQTADWIVALRENMR